MKIGILTFHMAFNHGAMLQAYALTKKLRLMGYDAEVIDYRLPYIDKFHHKPLFVETIKKYRFTGILRYAKRYINGYYSDKRWKKFYDFMTKSIPLSKQVTKEQLEKLEYDAYIVGSDQVWNAELTGGLQKCYFLDFVKNGAKKIAYAASSGTEKIISDNIDDIKTLLSEFNGIGIRESNLTHFINNNLKLSAQTVIDPVFLLESDEWIKMIKKTEEAPYLLIYTFDEKAYIYDKAIDYANKNGLKVITLAYDKKDLSDSILQLTDCGPLDFLRYIYNAQVVFTSSFHATAFSLIFKRQFFCFPHYRYNERTDNLLSALGLSQRNVYEKDDVLLYEDIDYGLIEENLTRIIKDSVEFLKEVLD